MYRLLAIAKYDERYVIPKAHVEQAHDLEELGCSLDFDGVRACTSPDRSARRADGPSPVAVETFHALRERQTSDARRREQLRGRVNLLNWDGNGAPPGLFPPRRRRGRAAMTRRVGGPASTAPRIVCTSAAVACATPTSLAAAVDRGVP